MSLLTFLLTLFNHMQTISDQTSFSTLAILIAPGSSANSYIYYKNFKDLFKKNQKKHYVACKSGIH